MCVAQTSAEGNPVHICSPGQDSRSWGLTKLMETFLSSDISMIKFTWRSGHFFPRFEPKLWENSLSRSVEESFEKMPRSISRCGWLPNLNQFSLSEVKFSWSPISFCVKLVTKKQTDRQTPGKTCPLSRDNYSLQFGCNWQVIEHTSQNALCVWY